MARSSGRSSTLLEWLLSLVIAAAVASAWRGAWLGIDAVLLRSSLRASAAVSLAAGSAQFLACVATQERLAAWSRKCSRRRALWAMDAAYSYLSFWSCVLVWRGVWELWTCAFEDGVWDMHPEPLLTRQLWTACVSHVAGVAVLLALGGVRNSAWGQTRPLQRQRCATIGSRRPRACAWWPSGLQRRAWTAWAPEHSPGTLPHGQPKDAGCNAFHHPQATSTRLQ